LLREAAEEMSSEMVPLRAKGLHSIRALLRRRAPAAVAQLPLLLDLAEAQMGHPDSFVYQAALNALAAAAELEPSLALPRLARMLVPSASELAARQGARRDRSSSSTAAAAAAAAGTDLRSADEQPISEEAMRRLKAAQASRT
jgi:hypothetical protein